MVFDESFWGMTVVSLISGGHLESFCVRKLLEILCARAMLTEGWLGESYDDELVID